MTRQHNTMHKLRMSFAVIRSFIIPTLAKPDDTFWFLFVVHRRRRRRHVDHAPGNIPSF